MRSVRAVPTAGAGRVRHLEDARVGGCVEVRFGAIPRGEDDRDVESVCEAGFVVDATACALLLVVCEVCY